MFKYFHYYLLKINMLVSFLSSKLRPTVSCGILISLQMPALDNVFSYIYLHPLLSLLTPLQPKFPKAFYNLNDIFPDKLS